MHELEEILRTNEDWLMNRILEYAKQTDYTKYTSTILEAWRLSISGLTEAISHSLASWPDFPVLGPEEVYAADPTTEFGIFEAQKHRERGINFAMFMGLFKFYRKTFHDLLSAQNIPKPKRTSYHEYLTRCFDRIEIAFATTWVELGEPDTIAELQNKNRLVVNEKNMFLTLLESVEHPIICVDEQMRCFYANDAFLRLLPDSAKEGAYYSGAEIKDSNKRVLSLDCAPWAIEIIHDFMDKNEQSASLQFSLESKQATAHYDIALSRLIDVSDKFNGCVLVMNDITKLQEAYEKARENEEKVQIILESSPLPLVITDAETGVVLYANKRMGTFMGISKQEVTGISARNFYVNPDDRQEMIDLLLSDGEFVGLERHIKTPIGEEHWVLMSGVTIMYGTAPAFMIMTQDITKDKIIQEERHKLFLAVDGSPTAVIITDPTGKIEYANKKFCNISGYSIDEVIGQNPSILKSGKQTPEFYQDLWATISSGREWHGELCNKTKRGDTYWEAVSISPIKDENGKISNYIALKEDITKRRAAEKALAASEERFRTLTEKLPAGVLVFNPDASVALFNDMGCALLGVDPADMKGKPLDDTPLWKFVDITGRPIAVKDYPVMRILAGEDRLMGLELGVTKDEGDITWLRVDAFRENNKDGKLESVIVHFTDITAFKMANEALSEIRSRLEEAQHIAKIGSWILDVETMHFVWSDEMYALFETTPEEFVPTVPGVLERVLPQFQDKLRQCFDVAIQRHDQYDTEYIITTFKGNQRYLNCRGRSVEQNGKAMAVKGTAQDITDRKAAEQAILESEQFQRILLDSIGAGVIMVWPNTLTVESMNIRAEELIGPGAKDMIGQSVNELCWQSMDGICTLGLPTMDENQTEEFVLIRPNGSRVPVTRTTVFVDVRGNPMYALIVFDITDRKALERQLNLAQKLEAIGSLAAGIAHEINTPVQYISSNMTYLKKAFEEIREQLSLCAEKSCCPHASKDIGNGGTLDSLCDIRKTIDITMAEIPEAIGDCQEGIGRVSEIVMSMRKFSHPDTEEAKPVDINSALENTLTISRNEWKYVAVVEKNLEEDLPPVKCAPGDCNQVLLNVVVNAAHAIGEVVHGTEEKGTITVSSCLAGKFVEVRIQDTGGGIPTDIQEKIFDPFFTTKEVGRGTGQGLAITHSILERYSGWINFETEVGVGTTFIIHLPVFLA